MTLTLRPCREDRAALTLPEAPPEVLLGRWFVARTLRTLPPAVLGRALQRTGARDLAEIREIVAALADALEEDRS